MKSVSRIEIVFTIFFCFMVLMGLNNSLGTVILHSIPYFGISPEIAGRAGLIKEGISVVAMLLASRILASWGRFRSLQLAMLLPMFACLWVLVSSSFSTIQMLFGITAFSFAICRVTVCSMTLTLYRDLSKQIQMLALLEALGKLGTFVGIFLFSLIMALGAEVAGGWLKTYWIFFLLIAIGLIQVTRLISWKAVTVSEQSQCREEEQKNLTLWMAGGIGIVGFLGAVFCSTFIEQGLFNWLPYFYHDAMRMDEALCGQFAVLYPLMIMLGRFVYSGIAKRSCPLFSLLAAFLSKLALYVFIIFQLAGSSFEKISAWHQVPFVAYAMPLLGFFQAPIFSIVCAFFTNRFSHIGKEKLFSMIGIFCAAGAAFGTFFMGWLFGKGSGLAIVISLSSIFLGMGMILLVSYWQGFLVASQQERDAVTLVA